MFQLLFEITTLSFTKSLPRMLFVAFMWLVSAIPYKISALCSDEGWFGPECELKCHCYPGIKCTENGNCEKQTNPEEDCDTGWFGPQCQHRDLVFAFGRIVVGGGNGISDCNLDSVNQTSLLIQFNESLPISWLEMKFLKNEASDRSKNEKPNVEDILKVPTFQLNFNSKLGSEDCCNQKVFLLTGAVEVWCSVVNLVDAILITGEILPSLCRVYVSGGRNIALKQTTNQSSTLDKGGFLFVSGLAVDGNSSQAHESTCAATEASSQSISTWSIFFPKPALLKRVIVYSRDEDCLGFFSLQTFDSAGEEIERYGSPGTPLLLVYDIILSQVSKTVSWLSIKGRIEPITLCEVETFGDIPCTPGKWGYLCANSCACDAQSNCSFYTGHCTGGCQAGRYGDECGQICPINCKGGICQKESGYCFDCLDRFYSLLCNKQCPPACNANCEFISGKCLPGDDKSGEIKTNNDFHLEFWLWVGIPCLATALCLFFALFCRRRKSGHQAEELHESQIRGHESRRIS